MWKRAFKLTALLLLFMNTLWGARVDTLSVYSAAMAKTVPCLIVLPESYSVAARPFPVLYLLHGWSGEYASWLKDAPQLHRHADTYRMIIVCPDGGFDSWYLDSPVDPAVRYDTHIALELVDYIDRYFNTRRDRGGRAIAGLSMGGHGALSIASRHPERFGAAGSMAGGLDLRPFRENGWDLKGVLGDPAKHWQNWEAASVVNRIGDLQKGGVKLLIDCGLGDFFLETNRTMHRLLLQAGYPHEYYERPGEHNGDYWNSAVDYQVVFFDKFFGRG